jgi:hypothetical protein
MGPRCDEGVRRTVAVGVEGAVGARLPAVVAGTIAVVVVLLVSACAQGESEQQAGEADRVTAVTGAPSAGPAPARADDAGSQDDGSETATDPAGIPTLELTPLGSGAEEWDSLRGSDDDLYAMTTSGRLARVHPATGEVLADAEVGALEGWTATPDGLVLLGADRRMVTVLEPDTLATRHVVDLGADARAGMNADLPRTSELWLGLRVLNADVLAGTTTRMEAVRLDLTSGTILERHPAPPCGAGSVVQPAPDTLVFGVACAEQLAILDLGTGALEVKEAFPAGAQLLALDGQVFIRWKEFGYLGRLDPSTGVLDTLDLNADGPVLSDLFGLNAGPRGIWVVGQTAEEGSPDVLHLVDPEELTVVARARIPQGSLAIVGDSGYTAVEGALHRFELSQVDGGAPDRTVRPALGAPAPVEPHTEEEQSVLEAFALVFDPALDNAAVADHLPPDPAVLDARQAVRDGAAKVWPGAEPVATALSTDGDAATLDYVFLVEGKLAFPPLSADLDRVDGRWIVTGDSICRLAELAAAARC